jgi:hypothetical protein
MSIFSNLLHGIVTDVLHPGSSPAPVVSASSKLAGPLNAFGSAIQDLAGAAAEAGESTVEGAIAEHGVELGSEAADLILGSIISAAQSKLSSAGKQAVSGPSVGSGVTAVTGG